MWEILKDIVAYLDWNTGDPLEMSARDIETYLASKGVPPEEYGSFGWITPGNLWRRTQAPDAAFTQHFEINQVRRIKREVVVRNSRGEIDLVLCRKK